jgi:hypothetical protein
VFVVAWPVAGTRGVPDPVPIVSPVVPLFMAPLLMPAPGLGRLVTFEPSLVGLPAAGETAESPDDVVEPVLTFCASANELVKITADAIMIVVNFMSNLPHPFAEAAADSDAFELFFAGAAAAIIGKPRRQPWFPRSDRIILRSYTLSVVITRACG